MTPAQRRHGANLVSLRIKASYSSASIGAGCETGLSYFTTFGSGRRRRGRRWLGLLQFKLVNPTNGRVARRRSWWLYVVHSFDKINLNYSVSWKTRPAKEPKKDQLIVPRASCWCYLPICCRASQLHDSALMIGSPPQKECLLWKWSLLILLGRELHNFWWEVLQ